MLTLTEQLNDDVFYVPTDDMTTVAENLGNRYAEVLKEQLSSKDNSVLRGSSLGKPAVELFARRFFPHWWANELPTERLMRLFHEGFVFEIQFEWFIHRIGKSFLTTHERYNLSSVLNTTIPISGELDYVLELDGVVFLVDAKTASSNSNRKMVSGVVPREYLVQQAVYKAAWEQHTGKRIDKTGLLVYNKDNSSVSWVEADPSQLEEALDHAKALCELWQNSSSWEEAIANGMCPPQPVPEVYRNRHTGAMLLPECMKYQPRELIEACYEVVEDRNGYGKDTIYVLASRW